MTGHALLHGRGGPDCGECLQQALMIGRQREYLLRTLIDDVVQTLVSGIRVSHRRAVEHLQEMLFDGGAENPVLATELVV